jgi:transcriptional regulator with XRE-family HTH domain
VVAKVRNRIAEWRRAAGLTQEELAERVGTTGNSISRLERGETRLNTEWMERLSKALGCEPRDLIANGTDEIATPAEIATPVEVDIITNWINQGLRKPGKTGRGLANSLGVNEANVSRMRARRRRSYRTDQLKMIADYIEEPIPLAPQLPELPSEPGGRLHSVVVGLASEPQEAQASRQLDGTQLRHVQTWECHKCGRVYPVTFPGPCICFDVR